LFLNYFSCNKEQAALHIVLYWCEISSLPLSEERGLKVFENRVLRKMFGPKEDEVAGNGRKMHDELHNLYSSLNFIEVIISRRMEHATRMGAMRNTKF
jgi:hypothetical protein